MNFTGYLLEGVMVSAVKILRTRGVIQALP